jgi:hypothetical protein
LYLIVYRNGIRAILRIYGTALKMALTAYGNGRGFRQPLMETEGAVWATAYGNEKRLFGQPTYGNGRGLFG